MIKRYLRTLYLDGGNGEGLFQETRPSTRTTLTPHKPKNKPILGLKTLSNNRPGQFKGPDE